MRPNKKRRLSDTAIGLIAVALTVIGFYLAFTKTIPFAGHGYQLKAIVQDAQNIRAKSPVRISGVNVGEVSGVQHLTSADGKGQDAAVVTMDLQDKALPIRQDATLQLRPRLFLEGNLFVDLHPGSPGAPELHSGSVIPENQTSNSVQLDQVLSDLQAPVRTDLQIFLKEFGGALDRYGGAKGLQVSYRTSPAAFEYTSQVNQALLGTQPGDLAGFVSNLDVVARELNANRTGLQGLITNLDTVAGDFAAHQASLRQAIVELPQTLAVGRPALFHLNQDFPALRAFSREALPGVKSANRALDYANPWIGQLRQLISENELRGLVEDLRPTVPDLAALSNETLPFLEQIRALSSCFDNVVIPWSNTRIPNHDSDPPAGNVYQETAYGFTGVAGESRSGDANGQEFRVLGGGGQNTIAPFSSPDVNGPLTGVSPFSFTGSEPAKQSSAKTPFRPDVPCETQDPPNLDAGPIGPAPSTSSSGRSATVAPPQEAPLVRRYAAILDEVSKSRQTSVNGNQVQARSLMATAQDQYASWLKDWNAFQRANGIKPSAPSTGKGWSLMRKAIHDHLRDFLAILGLLTVGLLATYIIVQNQRLRIPLLESKPFELKADMSTAQAVTPGQGQTVRVAGVRVGDISAVDYEDGHAVVTMQIDRKFLPVYKNATVLLRPKTGLKDMFLELDPGTNYMPDSNADEFQNGDSIPVANTAPDTNVDQILSALDGDTRAYLRLLLVGAGQGLDGRGKDLGKLLGGLGPINRGLARINTEVAKRKDNLANLIHNMNLLFGTVGQDGQGIEQLVTASNQTLGAIASQSPDVQRAVSLLGPTLSTTRDALAKTDQLAQVLGPTVNSLRPFARKLKPVNDSLGKLAQTTYNPIKQEIRPFVANARQPVRNLRPAAENLVRATPRLTTVGSKLNELFNMAAFNPNGAEAPGTPGRDEGYLYWLAWLGHVGNSTFAGQDAHGVYRHVYVVATCNTVKDLLATSPLAPAITGLGQLVGTVCAP